MLAAPEFLSSLMTGLARERAVLKPSQLNAMARDLLEGSFAQAWVQGEISNFSRPASGHLYFTLKDERAQVRCALFKQKALYLRFAPRDGLQVLVRGRLTLYEARGDYQLVLEHMEEAGEGALRRAYEELKARLDAEGLFAAGRKRALPRMPRRLGILTSPTGAAVRDVLSVLGRRFPLVEAEVLPVPVQGEGAAAQVRGMLEKAAASGRYDVLVLARGGGSLEDLWAFNDEALVRAVAACPVPVVSAIGHEVDFSLCDFAADLRAPTPSAAAELLVPDRGELSQRVGQLRHRLERGIQRELAAGAQRADQSWLRLQAGHPRQRLALAGHRAARLKSRLDARLGEDLRLRVLRLRGQGLRLVRLHPRETLARQEHALALRLQRLQAALATHLQRHALGLQALGRGLNAVNPFATLERGYAILRREDDGKVLTQARQASSGDRLQAQLADGVLDLRVE
jgi:exodeoxyribonuclease VII large subunit